MHNHILQGKQTSLFFEKKNAQARCLQSEADFDACLAPVRAFGEWGQSYEVQYRRLANSARRIRATNDSLIRNYGANVGVGDEGGELIERIAGAAETGMLN